MPKVLVFSTFMLVVVDPMLLSCLLLAAYTLLMNGIEVIGFGAAGIILQKRTMRLPFFMTTGQVVC